MLSKYDEWESGYGSEYLQRGRGGHVLCARCNHFTGGSYGSAFVEWSRRGLELIQYAKGRKSLNFHGDIYPLRVLKQLATIFCAINPPEFQSKNPELVHFVCDKERRGLPPNYEFRVFWYGGGSVRQSGVSAVANAAAGTVNICSEFVHPPFGYLLSLDGSPFDRRPESISHFATYELDEAISFNRRFPILETHWMMPGDYRTQEQITRDVAFNTLKEKGHPDPGEAIHRFERSGG